jgi:hypothetical protein
MSLTFTGKSSANRHPIPTLGPEDVHGWTSRILSYCLTWTVLNDTLRFIRFLVIQALSLVAPRLISWLGDSGHGSLADLRMVKSLCGACGACFTVGVYDDRDGRGSGNWDESIVVLVNLVELGLGRTFSGLDSVVLENSARVGSVIAETPDDAFSGLSSVGQHVIPDTTTDIPELAGILSTIAVPAPLKLHLPAELVEDDS